MANVTPDQALALGQFVKIIAGASNHDLASIEDLVGIYALAGVHCVDVAADEAVVAAARRGLNWARDHCLPGAPLPWLMISISDGVDPHFRKAWFDANDCPANCSRPCEQICPANAIPTVTDTSQGILSERCYGCGRCLPACPLGLIEERHHSLPAQQLATLLAALRPDAIEIHTCIGRAKAFAERLDQVAASGIGLRRLAVSCGLLTRTHGNFKSAKNFNVEKLATEMWTRFALLSRAGFLPLWQLDGRPMSGDVGSGTARAAVRLFEAVHRLAPPGPMQLAGGTNNHTLTLVQRSLSSRRELAGVAFGGAARQQ